MKIAPMPTSVTKVEKQALVLNHLLQKYHKVMLDIEYSNIFFARQEIEHTEHVNNIATYTKSLKKIICAYNALYEIIWESSWRNTQNLKRNQVLTKTGYENTLVLTYYNHTTTIFPEYLIV